MSSQIISPEPHGSALAQAQWYRAGDRPLREHTLLVEHAVVRQGVLVDAAGDFTVLQEEGRVEEPAVAPGCADDQRGPAVGRVADELVQGGSRMLAHGRLEHEILRRIADQEELGQDQQMGIGRPGAQAPRQGEVAGDVAHGRIRLGHGDDDLGGHRRNSVVAVGRRD